MKKIRLEWMFLLVFAAALSFAACGSEAGHDHDGDDQDAMEQTDANADEAGDTATMEEGSEEVDMSGPEYTSAYVCPMHCKGSGSAEPGKCPVCGMDYVASADHQEDADHQHN